MDEKKIEQLINLLEGVPLYKWEQLKELIDRKYKSQANKTQFIKEEAFVKYLIQELIQ